MDNNTTNPTNEEAREELSKANLAKSFFSSNMNLRRIIKFLIPLVSIIIVVIIICHISRTSAEKTTDNSITNVINEATLQKVLEISELSTVENTYNAIARAYTEDDEEIRYYVSYEGIIKAGFDFDEISIRVDEDGKIVYITVPEVVITDYIIDAGTLDFIFTDDKYNIATVSAEAYSLCLEDLQNRASNEETLLTLARENALSAIDALFEPWIKQVDSEYTVIVE